MVDNFSGLGFGSRTGCLRARLRSRVWTSLLHVTGRDSRSGACTSLLSKRRERKIDGMG